MGSRVELFEKIRRDREFEGLSRRGLARRYGVHRRVVRQALQSALPPRKRPASSRPAPALGRYRQVIDGWLSADEDAPKKQRHTAKRIHQRLIDEYGATVGETTVRDYVRRRRRELGPHTEAFCPQTHEPGDTAEVDWGEAKAQIAGQTVDVGLFFMRACFSGAAFVMAFEHQTQQAFLEGHVHALDWFGGVFKTIRYDNLKSAAKKVMKGRRRIESDRFIALRSHYLYDSWFTLVGIEGAHEKGGVEGEVGRFRRNHLVPVPEVSSLDELNSLIFAATEKDLKRRIENRPTAVGEALAIERRHLRSLPEEPYPTFEETTVRVNSKSMVTVRRNQYSVPVSLVGLGAAARIGASHIEIFHQGKRVARHPRLKGASKRSARLDHYLDLLKVKPGALPSSLALRQERDRGAWPGVYDELWSAISARVGDSEAARQMVDVLLLLREYGADRVELAVRGALACGAHDGRAVALLCRRKERRSAVPLTDLGSDLAGAQGKPPDLSDYDELRSQGRTG